VSRRSFLLAIVLLALVGITACSAHRSAERSFLGCFDLAVPVPAVRAALVNLSEHGTADGILALRRASLVRGPNRPLYAALARGRFRASGPMLPSGETSEMRFRWASLVFDASGKLWRVGLRATRPSSNSVDRRIFGTCNL
jgi:hypothetical protein